MSAVFNPSVVLLAGGLGARLREETEYRPKPMVTIGDHPILWHIVKTYTHWGLRHFIVCLGYKGQMIKEYFLNFRAMNHDFTTTIGGNYGVEYHADSAEDELRVTLADTGYDSMTGARIKQVERYIQGDTFCVTYGDGLADINIRQLLQFHHDHGRLATVTAVRPTSRFGILDISENSRVRRFAEKPIDEAWINAGYFVFDRRVLDYLKTDPDCVLEREPLSKLASDGQLVAYRHEGFFYAMDTYREFQMLNNLWNRGEAPWAVWHR